MKKETGLRGIAVLIFLLAAAQGFCAGPPEEGKGEAAAGPLFSKSPADSSRALLFFDFENGETGEWTVTKNKWNKGFSRNIVPATEYNHSRKALYLTPAEGAPGGDEYFSFADNGIEPIALTGDLYLSWAWNISRIEDMNGFWIYLNMIDRRTGKNFLVRAVNHTESMHDCLETYDPPMCWCYNIWPVYDFVWRRRGPFKPGDIVVDRLGLAAYWAEGVEAWVDNIRLGYGAPPESANTISDSARINYNAESKMTGFSYAFINHDNIPDRIEVYRERADIFINPHHDESEETEEGVVRQVRIVPDMSIEIGEQRGDAVVTPADFSGDGHPDLLFQFDDLFGNSVFENNYLKGYFREVQAGALHCRGEHGSGTAIADIDGDTDLDIFMYNGFRRTGNFGGIRVFRNEGAFQFTDWTAPSYLLSQGSFGGIFTDLDSDGFSDLFINYKPLFSGRQMLNFNDGSGRFRRSAAAMEAPDSTHFNFCTAADFDNDGMIDIYCTSDYIADSKITPSSRLLRNLGKGAFSDLTDISGAGHIGRDAGVITGDFNLDGLVDIYLISSDGEAQENTDDIESFIYMNQGGFRFKRSDRYSYLKIREKVRALAALDFDLDGDLDIVALAAEDEKLIIRENIGAPDNFLEVCLRGSGGNRAGLGGKVYIYEAGCLDQQEHLLGCREISIYGCRETKVPPVAHFGLGSHSNVDLKAVFPPSGGKEPVVKSMRNVQMGSFLHICQSENIFGRVFCSPRIDYIRSSLVLILFRLPLSVLSLLVFSAVLSSGLWIREGQGTGAYSAGRMTAGILALILAALLLYRSPPAGVAVMIAASAIIIFSYRVEEFLRRLIISESRRDKLEELLFDELSQVIHTEKKFSFLGEMARPDGRLDSGRFSDDFRPLDRMVSAMRMVSPSDPGWRIIRKEIEKIKEAGSRLLSQAEQRDPRSTEMKLFRHSLQRLNSLLQDYRWKLRIRYSVNFNDEWNGLREEYRESMKEIGIRIDENFPEDISARSVHLLPEEFRHIFKNLYDNSIYALRDSDRKRIMVSGWYEANYLVIEWRDTGPGLPPGMEDKIFVSPVSSSRPGGMGEGCYQSRNILNRRGGRIRAESTPGEDGLKILMKVVMV